MALQAPSSTLSSPFSASIDERGTRMAEEAKWYVAHTYSGYENTVKATIEKAVENRNMGDLILAVNIPLETVTEITDAGSKTVERKVFPGYVLVKMVMTDETWHLVRNVRGVHRLCRLWQQAHPPHRGGDRRPGRGKAGGPCDLPGRATTSASPTARWSPSSASWKRSTPSVKNGCGWWCPCSAGRPRWNWTWIKSSPDTDPAAVPRAWEEWSSAPSNHIFIIGGALSGTESNWIR